MKRFWEMILGWVFSALLLLLPVSLAVLSGEIRLLIYLLGVSATIEGVIIFASIWDYFNG